MLVCGDKRGQSPPQTWGVGRAMKEEEEGEEKEQELEGEKKEETHPGVSITQKGKAIYLKMVRFHAL